MRRRKLVVPARRRRRGRRASGSRGRFLWHGEEDDVEESSGHNGAAKRSRWPRGLKVASDGELRAAPKTAWGEGEEVQGVRGKDEGVAACSVAPRRVQGRPRWLGRRGHAFHGGELPALSPGGRRQGRARWDGPLQLVGPEAQVSGLGFIFLFLCFCFLFSIFLCFVLLQINSRAFLLNAQIFL